MGVTSAVEQFTIELARVSKRLSPRLKRMPRQDREEIVANALAWCWEHRDEFKPETMTLEQWWLYRVDAIRRTAAKQSKRDAERYSDVRVEVLTASDDTAYEADELTRIEKRVALALASKLSEREVRDRFNISYGEMRNIMQRLRERFEAQPDHPISRATQWRESDDSREAKAPIDHEIEHMLRRPKTERADCPVCWRCSWYYGLQPTRYKARKLSDKELETAVHDTEARKIEIARRT